MKTVRPSPAVEKLLINRDGAERVEQSISDPFVRQMVRAGVGLAVMRFMQGEDQGDAAFAASLPREPFDMEFYAKLLSDLFAKRERLEAALRGGPFDEWDSV